MKKIVVASDSFKGSATSVQVAEAAERGIRRALPGCEVAKVAVADGGEGTVGALLSACGGQRVAAHAHDPLMRPIEASYAILDDGRSAVVEMAAAGGLTLISRDERDPLRTTSYGTGELIADALGRGCRHIIIGVGGTATCDGAVGLLSALGFRFADSAGADVAPGGVALAGVALMATPNPPLPADTKFTLLTDVTNPLLGPDGAAAVFAPQKGAGPAEVDILEAGLRNLAHVVGVSCGVDISHTPGGGAGGGAAAVMAAVLGAEIVNGIDYVLRAADFEGRLAGADLVITGEGRIDRQTLGGKAPAGILAVARRHGVPVAAIAGQVEGADELRRFGFADVRAIHSRLPSDAEKEDAPLTLLRVEDTVYNMVSGFLPPDEG